MNNFSIKRNLINIFKIIPNPFPLKKKIYRAILHAIDHERHTLTYEN